MKKILGLILLPYVFLNTSFTDKTGHRINVHIEGLKDTICHLAGYYGPKLYYKDTVRVDSKGNFAFEGIDTLMGGIYAVIVPGNKYFEFIVNEQFFSIESSMKDLAGNLKFKDSKENEVFYNYISFLGNKQGEVQPLRTLINEITKMSDSIQDKSYKSDSLKIYRQKITDIDEEVKNFQKSFLEENKNTLAVKIFTASNDVEIPEAPMLPNGRKDSTFAYRFIRKHYFDNLDFSDERMIHTPIFHKKIRDYINNVIPQHPDSIISGAHFMIGLAKANDEIFKYVVHYITNTYEQSKYMGMDAVFVDMIEHYYATGDAYWVDSVNLFKIIDRAKSLKPTLIGKIAPNLIMKDSSGKYVSMHHLPTRYVLLVFWDPDCGHCKKAMPKIKDTYDKWKNEKVPIEVFSVCTEVEEEKWRTYIKSHNFNWIDVGDFELRNNFREIYDISSTPRIFLLDEKRKIIAKQLSEEQLVDFVNRILKEDKKKEEKN